MIKLKLFMLRHPHLDKVNTAICYSYCGKASHCISDCSTWVYAETLEFPEQQAGPVCVACFASAGELERQAGSCQSQKEEVVGAVAPAGMEKSSEGLIFILSPLVGARPALQIY